MDLYSAAMILSFLTIAALITLTILLLNITTRLIISRKSTRKLSLNLPPGSYGWPILGETLDYLNAGKAGAPEKFVTNRTEKYDSHVFKTSLMGEKMAVLTGPAGNKFLFSNENKLVTIWWPASVRELHGPCLLTMTGDEAKQMRKMMSYFFSPDAFTSRYIKTMDLVAQQHIATHWEGKEEVKVLPTTKLLTFAIACRLFVSLEDTEEISKLASQFNIFLKGVISLPINFPGTRFFSAMIAVSNIKNQLRKIISQRRATLEQITSGPPKDLLSHLLVTKDDNGKHMSESMIINNILLLLFAGSDTSSVTITLLMKNLAQHPQVLEKVLTEMNGIAALKQDGEFLNWEDIQKMKYSWSVICETIRVLPPVVGAFREAIADIKYAGYDIPKGWKLYWSASASHKDPSSFPDCLSFDPSRFEGVGPVPYAYIPFGGGPRMCLGKEFARLEMLIFLYNVVRRFRWELKVPGEKIVYDPMATPVEGLPIRIYSRIPAC